MKKYIRMNNNDNHLSWGNLSRIIKENTINKTSALQSEIFCIIFNIDSINDTTVNNYCIGCRAINNSYKEIFIKYKNQYQKNKYCLIPNIINLISIIDGKIYYNTTITSSLNLINNNTNLKNIILKLYNISKNDKDVSLNLINNLKNFIDSNNLYETICEILFYIILEKKQPLYEDNIKRLKIENLLENTLISVSELEEYLTLKFREGINYHYTLKKMADNGNVYACLEIASNEYIGTTTGTPRYNISYKYFEKARLANHPTAYYMIANMYIKGLIGKFSKKEMSTALEYILKAIELGSIAAINTLGNMYLNGIYVKKDKDKAINQFIKAANYEYPYAYNNLGKIFENNKDMKKAFEYYLKSANLEESWACNKVAEFYRLGIFVKQDKIKAFEYYNKAIKGERRICCHYAFYNLAKYYYLDGYLEIEKNIDIARNYFEIAAKNNIELAYYELFNIYAKEYKKTRDRLIYCKLIEISSKIETSNKYNNNVKRKIDNTLKNINTKIDLDIIK